MSNANSLYAQARAHLQNNRLTEAEATLVQSLEIDPAHAARWVELGILRKHRKDFVGAIEANEKAIATNPRHAEAWQNTGICLVLMNADSDALSFFEMAAQINPSADLLSDTGLTAFRCGQFQKAAVYFKQAADKSQKNPKILLLLAVSHEKSGNISEGLEIAHQLLKRDPKNKDVKSLLVRLLSQARVDRFDEAMAAIVNACLSIDDISLTGLAAVWSTLVLTAPDLDVMRKATDQTPLGDLAAALVNPLLIAGLRKVPVSSIPVEMMMTAIRRLSLMQWRDADTWPKEIDPFLSAQATACWYNEYLYRTDADEAGQLQALRDHLTQAIRTAGTISSADHLRMMIYAAYAPLYGLAGDDIKIFNNAPSKAIDAVYTLQIREPAQEAKIKTSIKSFSEIEDDVSAKVRAQYEQRPYPRWRAAPSETENEQYNVISQGMSILIGGCGTGQEAMKYAAMLPKASVTAIDLSRSSLAYGKRMADKILTAGRIDFKHGDLLQVSALNKTFDIVSSSGVIHHMHDPEAGLKSLLSVLAPGGRLHIELYSEAARQHVLGPAWDYIRDQGYTAAPDDVRRFRDDIMALPDEDPRRRCTTVIDFFNLSECVDLLFHVQEHRYTIPQLAAMFQRAGLEILSFPLPNTLRGTYTARFPDDPGGYRLENLAQFEAEHPRTFLAMYKIWLRRAGETAPHPIDPMILKQMI